MATREDYRTSLVDKLVALEDGGTAKPCTSCKKVLPLEGGFHRNPRSKDGRQAKCRTCSSEYGKQWYQANKESVAQKCSDYYERNKARYRVQRREWRLRTAYGLSSEEYDAMFARRKGCCAACGRSDAERLVDDHCHDSGVVRGLVCDGCNLAIGLAEDSPMRLRRMAAYLETGDA